MISLKDAVQGIVNKYLVYLGARIVSTSAGILLSPDQVPETIDEWTKDYAVKLKKHMDERAPISDWGIGWNLATEEMFKVMTEGTK